MFQKLGHAIKAAPASGSIGLYNKALLQRASQTSEWVEDFLFQTAANTVLQFT